MPGLSVWRNLSTYRLHLTFSVGSAIKYLWRAELKGDVLQNLEKAARYISREIERNRRLSGGLVTEGKKEINNGQENN